VAVAEPGVLGQHEVGGHLKACWTYTTRGHQFERTVAESVDARAIFREILQ
jgi:hypothetical protein